VTIVPSSASKLKDVPFKVQEITDKKTTRALTWDVLLLGLYGKGKVGLKLAARHWAADGCELALASSGLTFNTPLSLSVVDRDGHVVKPGDMRVGQKLKFAVERGGMFAGYLMTIRLWEGVRPVRNPPDRPPSEAGGNKDRRRTQAPWRGLEHTWQANVTPEPRSFLLGVDGDAFYYSHAIGTDAKLEFSHEIEFRNSDGTEIPSARLAFAETMCKIDPPSLKDFQIGLPKADANDEVAHLQHRSFLVSATVANLSPDFTVPAAIALYTRELPPVLSGQTCAPVSVPPDATRVAIDAAATEGLGGALGGKFAAEVAGRLPGSEADEVVNMTPAEEPDHIITPIFEGDRRVPLGLRDGKNTATVTLSQSQVVSIAGSRQGRVFAVLGLSGPAAMREGGQRPLGEVLAYAENTKVRISGHREREDRTIVNGRIGHREREDRSS
jgi:hypothetical protein